MTILKVKPVFRNSLCQCGSGKKSKYCCKMNNEYHYIKSAEEIAAENAASNSEPVPEVVEN